MGLLMLLAATISATASSQAEIRIQGNSTNVKIEMTFDTPTKTQSLQAVISQLSSSVFQIVVANEQQACQLARIINSDLSPCFHEQRKENEPEDTDAVVFYRNVTSKQRKTAQNALWLPKKHTSISALHPTPTDSPPRTLTHTGAIHDVTHLAEYSLVTTGSCESYGLVQPSSAQCLHLKASVWDCLWMTLFIIVQVDPLVQNPPPYLHKCRLGTTWLLI
jgi:hypothetical protein